MIFARPVKVVGLFVLTLCPALLVLPASMSADTNVSYEKYGTTSTGVDLYWTAYVPADGLRHPAVLVLHPGGFKAGDAGPLNVAEDLGNAGFFGLATEYRLAPPHDEMDSPSHPVPGQNDVFPVDNGHYPEQTDDVQLAIRTARADPRCDGRVYCVGGSAGAAHSVYMAATGAAGDDRPDLVVGLSGPYELDDLAHLQAPCVPDETCFVEAVLNYLPEPSATDVVDHNYTPYLADLHAASPTTYVNSDMPPLFLTCSSNDTGGVDTFQLPDLIAKLNLVGLTETSSSVPTASQYKKNIIPVPAPPAPGTHAFAYWYFPIDGVIGHPTVATTVINWLQAGPLTSNSAPTQELLNVSTRSQVLGGDKVLIGGFIITGNVAKTVVLRALGPSLAEAGVTGVLADPTLELYDSAGALIQQDDNWVSPLPANVVAAGLTPKDPAESLITATLRPGSYTAVLQGAGGSSSGVGLFELYDLDPADSLVSNLSTRGEVGGGDHAMIGGFIVGGTQATEVLIRATGPSLTNLGVSGALLDPVLELHGSDGSLLAENDNWRSDQEQEILATTIAPSDDKESAILATLAPGNYTALVRGAGSSSGIALVEVYSLTSN